MHENVISNPSGRGFIPTRPKVIGATQDKHADDVGVAESGWRIKARQQEKTAENNRAGSESIKSQTTMRPQLQ